MQLWTVIDGDIYLEEGMDAVSIRYYPDEDAEYINPYHIDQTREYKS